MNRKSSKLKVEVLTCVFPLPVCPYAKQVAIPLSKMVSTSGWAVNLRADEQIISRTKHTLMFLSHFFISLDISSPVDHFIGGVLVEGVVESEGLVLQVTGQVDFLLGLVDHHHVLTGDGDHVQILHRQLWEHTDTHQHSVWTNADLKSASQSQFKCSWLQHWRLWEHFFSTCGSWSFRWERRSPNDWSCSYLFYWADVHAHTHISCAPRSETTTDKLHFKHSSYILL